MSSRGINQVKKMSFIFCPNSNSNVQWRNYLCSQVYEKFEQENTSVQKNFYTKKYTDPILFVTYINGYVKEFNFRKESMETIHNRMIYAVSSFGKEDQKQMGKNVFGHRKSLQGEWTSSLWYNGPEQELERRKPIPQKIINMDQFLVKSQEKRIKKDNKVQKFINEKPARDQETRSKWNYKNKDFKFTKQQFINQKTL